MSDLADRAHRLLNEQRTSWELLRRNCGLLDAAQTRTFDFGRFAVKAQLNLARLASVSARVDPETIRRRKCFLCDANRPIEQLTLDCGHGFKLLCNPFPILPEHFTLVYAEHRPQRILDSIGAMLAIAQAMAGRYTVFYNGPQCGASAPDHLHFQAGAHGFMPIDNDYDRVKHPLGEQDGVSVFVDDNYLRRFVALESSDQHSIERVFSMFHGRLRKLQPQATEPMMNVICSYANRAWRLILFPRTIHRPSFYFATDHARMLLSPGAVDMGGVVVMPVEQDFARITREHLIEMYAQVTLPRDLFGLLTPFPGNGLPR